VCQREEYAIILSKQTAKHSPSTDQRNGLKFFILPQLLTLPSDSDPIGDEFVCVNYSLACVMNQKVSSTIK
jgi:hypothetical protein